MTYKETKKAYRLAVVKAKTINALFGDQSSQFKEAMHKVNELGLQLHNMNSNWLFGWQIERGSYVKAVIFLAVISFIVYEIIKHI